MWTFFCRGGGSRLRSFEAVHGAYQHEDHEGNNDEVNDRLHERALLDNCLAHNDCLLAEIDATENQSNQWHENIVDKRSDNFSKRTPDDHCNCQVHYITPHGEFSEFLQHI